MTLNSQQSPSDARCGWLWAAFVLEELLYASRSEGKTFTAARTLPKTLSHHSHWRFQSSAFEPSHPWFFYYFILGLCTLVNFFYGQYWWHSVLLGVDIPKILLVLRPWYVCKDFLPHVASIMEFSDAFAERILFWGNSHRFRFSIEINKLHLKVTSPRIVSKCEVSKTQRYQRPEKRQFGLAWLAVNLMDTGWRCYSNVMVRQRPCLVHANVSLLSLVNNRWSHLFPWTNYKATLYHWTFTQALYELIFHFKSIYMYCSLFITMCNFGFSSCHNKLYITMQTIFVLKLLSTKGFVYK